MFGYVKFGVWLFS